MSELKSKLSRRAVFAAAGTVGALTAATSLLPSVVQEPETTAPAKKPPDKGGGYQLTDHVKQYYKSTLV